MNISRWFISWRTRTVFCGSLTPHSSGHGTVERPDSCWTSVLDPPHVLRLLRWLASRPGCWGFVCSFMCCSSLSSFCFLFSLLLPVSVQGCSHLNSQWRNQNSVLVLLVCHQDFLQGLCWVYYRRTWHHRGIFVLFCLTYVSASPPAACPQTGGSAATCRWPSTAAQHSG